MAINRNISRLATEDELNGALSVFDPNWMNLTPEQKQQNAMSALDLYGGDRNQLLSNFNQQFNTTAGMSDLDYLLNYKPADQGAVVSGPITPVQDDSSVVSGLDYATKEGGIGENQYYENIRNRVTDIGGSGLGALDQAAKLREEAGQYGISNQDISNALGIPLADVNALLNPVDTSNVLDTIGATFDQDALDRLTASVDADAIAEDLSPKVDEAKKDTVRDFQGNEFSGSEILNLAQQISGSVDTSKVGGAVYGTKGESIGFDYEEAKNILGREPTAADQVLLDMARSLRQKGVTDLSQIKVEDVVVNQESSVYTDPETGEKFLVDADGAKIRSLTPEEVSNIRLKEVGSGDNTYTQEVLDTEVKTKQTVGPDGKPIYLYGEEGGNVFGETYTGEGATDYVMVFDEETGKPKFYTTGRSTSDMEKISMAMTFLSFIPGVAPFIQAIQGAYALKEGDPLAAIANLAGAAGYGDVARIAGAANAASKGDVLGAAFSLAGTSFGADFLKTDLGGGFTMNDVVTAGKIVSGIDKGDYGLALSAAGDLMKSSDLKVASAGINVYNAIKSGDPLAMIRAVDDANKIVQYIGGNTSAKDTITTTAPAGSGLTVPGSTPKVSLTETGQASLTGTGSLSDQAWEAGLTSFMNASNKGLSFEDALAASNREVGGLLSKESGGALATPYTGIADLKGKEDWDKAVNAYTYAINKGADPKDAFTFSKLVASGQQIVPTETKLDANNVTLTKSDDKTAGGSTQVGSIKLSYGTEGDKDMGTIYVFGPNAQASFSEVMNLPGAQKLSLLDRKDGEIWEVDDQTYYKNGDKIYSMPTVAAQAIGVPIAALGEMMSAAGGAAAATGAAKQDNWFTRTGNELNTKGIEALGQDVNTERKNIVNAVQNEEGFWNKFKAVVKSSIDNPLGAASYVAVELPQEFAVIGAATKVARLYGIVAGVGADMGMNAIEAAGAGYNEAYNQAIRAGKNEEEARDVAMDRALVDAALAATVGSVVDASIIKSMTKASDDVVNAGLKTFTDKAADVGKGVGKSVTTTGKEFGTEGIEAGAGAAVTDLGITGKVDWNNLWTSVVIEGAIGGKTAGTIQTSVTAVGPDSSTADVVYSLAPTNGDSVMSTVSSITSKGGSPADVAANLNTALTDLGLSVDQAKSISNTAIAESAVNQINSGGVFTIGDVSTIVGTDSAGNNVTLGDVIADASLNAGGKFDVDSSVVIGTNADGSSMTLSDLAEASKGGTVIETKSEGGVTTDTSVNNVTGSTTTTTTDSNNNTSTTSTVNANNGSTTTTTVDGNANTVTTTDSTADVNSTATVDGNSNTANVTQTDLDSNVVTDTSVDANNGTVTTVTTDSTSDVTTTTNVDNTNNTQTSVTTDGGVTTETSVDPDNNNATVVTTDGNVQTTTTIDTNTNTVITVTTDLNTGVVISEEEKPVGDVPITQILNTLDPTKKTTKTTKSPTATPTGAMPLALGAALAANPSLAAEFENLFSGPAKKFKSPLDDFMQQVDENYAQQVADQEAAEAAQRAQEEEMRKYYSYGRERDIDDILGEGLLEESPLSESFEGLGMSDMYPRAAKAGGLMTPLMAKGGNPPAVHYAGKPRIDFRKGAHVAGPGDGQSDDIPAMLADGEFVFPADVVAALGNGSTKAGSDKLYEMMHEIRRRYRSAKPKDLPPPAKKSPLEYLSKKGRR